MTKKTFFTVGFIFDFNSPRVALLRKARPKNQNGLLNGCGGHFEPDERPDVCMEREFREELEYPEAIVWNAYHLMNGNDWAVHCFVANGHVDKLKAKTDEPLEIIDLSTIHPGRADMVANVPWLIAMAENVIKNKGPVFSMSEY